MSVLTEKQIQQFIKDGYLVVKQLADTATLEGLINAVNSELHERKSPFELEASLQYPGAPKSEKEQGGQTIRRLQQVYARGELFQQWANNAFVCASIRQLLKTDELYLSQMHHNSVMTKHPAFSSQTQWHRDTRYWNFSDKYLINSWLALGDEREENGGLWVLPGSHRWEDSSMVLDDMQFLVETDPANQSRLSLAKQVYLDAGDVLFFSAHCFHAASQNHTNKTKMSLVYTYHGAQTQAKKGTRSSTLPSIKMA